MKSKFLKRFLATVLVVLLGVSVIGCKGKSAYDIAVENGFIGTEQEWLESLTGEGLDIYDLYDAYKSVNEGATFEQFLSEFMVINYNDTEYASAKALLSSVSVYCTFTKRNASYGENSEYGSAGSGIIYKIIDDFAYIITNYHVVYDRDSSSADRIAHTIEVYSYGFEYLDLEAGAQFVGGSISKDIAIIRAPISAFPTEVVVADLAELHDVNLGERVVAVGNPRAEGISVTTGVISMDSQEIEMEALDNPSNGVVMRVLRTDTAINSGNSGGGLFNMRGQLVGIINAKTVESGIEGMGYAIPLSVAKGIADSVIDGFNKKCLLGVTVKAVTSQTIYNSEKNRVEIVERITIDETTSSLVIGRLLKDDVLVSARLNDGAEVKLNRIFHLGDFLYSVRYDDTIYLTVLRNNSPTTVELKPQTANFTNL